MKVAVTGATGLIGSALVGELRARDDEITLLSRDPEKGVAWDPARGPAPAEALAGRDAVVHLAAENLAQRWSDGALRRIRDSREQGTRALVDGIGAAAPRPRTLVSVSAVGYYGDRGDERLDDDSPPGDDFLANVCIAWEREAQAAEELGLRVVRLRNGVVLHRRGAALSKMLPPFRLGIAGPVAGGRQYISWIHLDDVVGMIVRALDDDRWTGALNSTAPEPVTNREFSKALGRALRRPAVMPVPGFALRLLYGGMAELITKSQRAVPRRALELGYEHRHPEVGEALRAALA